MTELDAGYCTALSDRLEDLQQRMARAVPLPPDAPDGLRAVPLPFALPAPAAVRLHGADKRSDSLDLKQLRKVPHG